ncbi:hypothetical protein B0J12DRAFT_376103 [Macrophomina phaseolina]|uniref:Secreted protein n=1 Tax=Macrophomina phaseolina TaxID=35725 RepID=A0ABQ8GKB9_9PEZI|nr:hypothetical protein B0J12DRAFT_376103 [Macrophomina phaseolina]
MPMLTAMPWCCCTKACFAFARVFIAACVTDGVSFVLRRSGRRDASTSVMLFHSPCLYTAQSRTQLHLDEHFSVHIKIIKKKKIEKQETEKKTEKASSGDDSGNVPLSPLPRKTNRDASRSEFWEHSNTP